MEKISSGKMKLEMNRENITSLVQRGIEENLGYAEKYNVLLDFETDDANHYAAVDSGKFLQVLSNLLSNAAKFSPSGGGNKSIDHVSRRETNKDFSVRYRPWCAHRIPAKNFWKIFSGGFFCDSQKRRKWSGAAY